METVIQQDITSRAADNIRILVAAMVEEAKSGHPGGAMGGADFMSVLFSEFLEFDPQNPEWFFRDRFFMDPGHMSAMLYSTLSFFGFYSMEELKAFRQWGSVTPGHPEVDFSRGIENTSGPLGQGHVNAVGAAIAERFLAARFGEWTAHKTYAYISDGGIQEEVSQGAGRIAGHLGLSNLIMFYDSNDLQLSSPTSDVTTEDTAKKYEAWGWKVYTIDGNDPQEIRRVLKLATQEKKCPSLIIGKTVMGKGAVDASLQSYERKCNTHGQPLSKAGASFEQTVLNLGGDPDNAFQIFPEVKEYMETVIQHKKVSVEFRYDFQKGWVQEHPQLARKLQGFMEGKLPEIDWNQIEQQKDIATRNASSAVLAQLAQQAENIIVTSADLSNSDKTDGFLKHSKILKKNDFSGAFLQAGVAELTMAAIANGMALHGGVIPICATFFVFSDFMKPAIRLAALMELPVKYIWTHDSFRVGEDGPTHQPIEQETQIRLMEKVKNHSGHNSMLVLRPADAEEATVAWKMALENQSTPTGLIFSRQNITTLPANNGVSRKEEAQKAEKGGYLVQEVANASMVLVGNGSEVATLVRVAEILALQYQLGVNVASVISEGLFREQDEEYQARILPPNMLRFGLTAGLPANLQNLIGAKGAVFGLDHFGYSAPANQLEEKFGFTATTIASKILEFVQKHHPALLK